jgi:hypothetical protein
MVVASVAEAEYAAAFGGGQVLAELTLTLTNLGHPQQSPPLLFVDNECAIGLATSLVRPKKSKSIDMRLDWLKERADQQFFRLIFLPGLIKPADFVTKILPVYRHIAALPFLHGTPYPIPSALQPNPITPLPRHRSSWRCSPRQGPTPLPYPTCSLTAFFFTPPFTPVHSRIAPITPSLTPVLPPTLNRDHNAPANPKPTAGCW